MKRLLALLLVSALFAVACGEDDAPVENTTSEAPERIVSLSPTATEILFAIGAGDQVVAVDQFSNYPENAPFSDLDGFQVNVEAVAAYDPQVVVMQSTGGEEGLEALGITVLVQDSPADLEGIYAQIEEIGAATGNEAGAADLVAEMRDRIDELVADAPDASGLRYYHELGEDYYSLNSDSFVAQVYGLFGLVSIGDDAAGEAFDGYLPLAEEFILEADPDLIFLADTIWAGQTAETVAARPGWADLTAVQTGAVVELNDDVASRWGPRVVEFVEAIAAVLDEVSVPA
ncbi:MAG: ABC transporter substrate-binding protein [Acidimicrobiales bacterium]|nr:ABC transporter substrate-binding protein [Acidimicrobiales bacterium]